MSVHVTVKSRVLSTVSSCTTGVVFGKFRKVGCYKDINNSLLQTQSTLIISNPGGFGLEIKNILMHSCM